MATAGVLVRQLKSRGHLLAPVGMLLVVFLILVPLPPQVLDVFFTFNIIASITILLMSTYIKDPVEFSVFPSLLLLAALYRLALNISSTRLILTRGDEGIFAAGKVIGSFGSFVVSGSFLIGLVVFIIVIAVQKIVVATGAGRAGEVAARFTLDKMPGKQMGIDADLGAGLITREEALERRKRIEREAEFFGTMDGAVKFTTKEANVSIIITLINIIGGILVGVFQKGMSFAEAGRVFTTLTVGDGLMAVVPSLLITVSGGLITTRAVSDKTLGEDITEQALFDHRPMMLAAIGLGLTALVPGLPGTPFFLLAGMFGYLAYQVRVGHEGEAALKREEEKRGAAARAEKVESLLGVDMLGLEVGHSLVPLVDADQDGSLLGRVKEMRRQLAMDLGVIVPPMRIRDNLRLGRREYSFLLKGVPIAGGDVQPDRWMAINPGAAEGKPAGTETRDPAFGLTAYWIEADQRDRAEEMGYTVVSPDGVIATHLTEMVRGSAHELLGRQEAQHLLDTLAATHPRVVEELIPNLMTLGSVRKVLQNLLREGVSISDLRTILETLADYAPAVKDLGTLTELVRQALAGRLVRPYITGDNHLPVLVLGGDTENLLISKIQRVDGVEQLIIDPGAAQGVIDRVRAAITASGMTVRPVLLCSSAVRPHIRQLTARFLPDLVVLSAAEVPRGVKIISLGAVE